MPNNSLFRRHATAALLDTSGRVALTMDADTAARMLDSLTVNRDPEDWQFRVVTALAAELAHPAYKIAARRNTED